MNEQRIAPDVELNPSDCTVAEGELIVHLGLLEFEGDLIDWETELEADLPPLLSPSSLLVLSCPPSSPVPTSSPEWAPISQSSHERDTVPKSSQEWALSPEGSPESPEAHE